MGLFDSGLKLFDIGMVQFENMMISLKLDEIV